MKSPTASKREVRTALAAASHSGQALSECIDAIQRLASTGEGLAGIVDGHNDTLQRLARRLDTHADRLADLATSADLMRGFRQRSFWQRMRWIVLGR